MEESVDIQQTGFPLGSANANHCSPLPQLRTDRETNHMLFPLNPFLLEEHTDVVRLPLRTEEASLGKKRNASFIYNKG